MAGRKKQNPETPQVPEIQIRKEEGKGEEEQGTEGGIIDTKELSEKQLLVLEISQCEMALKEMKKELKEIANAEKEEQKKEKERLKVERQIAKERKVEKFLEDLKKMSGDATLLETVSAFTRKLV